MDFFEHQQRSRRRSRWLVALFVLAVAATAAGVSLVVALLVHAFGSERTILAAPDATWLATNRDLLVASAAATIIVIGAASWLRLIRLRSGGSGVAEALGGAPVQPGDADPARRRLYNVVEEMAIASGLPVPAVFVLEREAGINAFAAGHTPADAAIAVTRGALVHLSRDELQGVVGHEFSHILHGDMRLNLRLMGYLFGILVVNMVGRAMVRVGGRRSVHRSRGRGHIVIVLAGAALYVLGYAGVLVGRIIQAAVCRQREYLADAASVQFTRQTDGLANALRKIAGLNRRSYLRSARAEEVSHMLFSAGRKALTGLLATHPPIKDRLRALQPYADTAPIYPAAAQTPAETPAAANATESAFAAPAMATSSVTANVGTPGDAQLIFANDLVARIPEIIWDAGHRPDRALPLALSMMLDADPALRAHQLNLIEVRFGSPVARTADGLYGSLKAVDDDDRLAMLDVMFPTIRRLRTARRNYLLETMERLAELDGHWAPFERAVVALLRSHVRDLAGPGRPRPRPDESGRAAAAMIARMALAGHEDRPAASAAYQAGLSAAGELLPGNAPALPADPPGAAELDRDLGILDALEPLDKRTLIAGLAAAAASDGRIVGRELTLLRAVCGALHCPLPPMPGTVASGD